MKTKQLIDRFLAEEKNVKELIKQNKKLLDKYKSLSDSIADIEKQYKENISKLEKKLSEKFSKKANDIQKQISKVATKRKEDNADLDRSITKAIFRISLIETSISKSRILRFLFKNKGVKNGQ